MKPMNPIQTLANHLFKIHFNILHLYPDLIVGLFPSGSLIKIFQSPKFFKASYLWDVVLSLRKSLLTPFTVSCTTNEPVAADSFGTSLSIERLHDVTSKRH
jgi:hypothetical protein